jgi:cbb3-type cytochrome oxidase maturation protein
VSIAYLLVALGIGVFALAVWALFWAIDSGQYDDVEKHGAAALEDDDPR